MIPKEADEQAKLFQWAKLSTGKWLELGLLFAIPNGGSRNKIEAHNLKKQGVKKGVPDLFLPVARGEYHGLFIEMKRQKSGIVSTDQKMWLQNLQVEGYKATIAKGFSEAKEIIENYMNLH